MKKIKFNRNHIELLKHLRNNSRVSFAKINKVTHIPTSTLFDYYQLLKKKGIIKKTTSLVDFKQLNYPLRIIVFIKAHKRLKLYKFLSDSKNINTISKLENFDFSFEAFFKSLDECEDFMESLSDFELIKLQKYDILEEVKREEFLCSESS